MIKFDLKNSIKSGRFFLYGAVIFGLLAFDLWTKAIVDSAQWKCTVIPGVLEIFMSYNKGSAFSFLSGVEWAQTFFVVFTIIVCIVLTVILCIVPEKKVLAKLALAFLIGGALGNLVDRMALHFVRDFMYLPWFGHSVCNFADYFIVAGCVMLFVHLLFVDEDALIPIFKKHV